MKVLIIGKLHTGISEAANLAILRGARIIYAETEDDGLNLIRSGNGIDTVLIDVELNIKNFIDSINLERINIPVIACGFSQDPVNPVKSIKAGAKDYILLPPDEKLIAVIFESITSQKKPIFSKSPSMQSIIDIADKVAPSNANILITGKSGTGKEVLAHYIHSNSNRSSKAFIRVNCAAIPEQLLESELFGHEKGAFTGAIARRIGRFEESSGGTLMLDEISEMDIKLQAKLLRAIQEQEITRVGGNDVIKVNLRVIATSNRNLEEEILRGTFREDLYFRLNVIQVELPPLKDRKEDIFDLAMFFIRKYSESNFIELKPLSNDAVIKLLEHNWPGNIRELENTIHRAILLSGSKEIIPENIILSSNFTSKGSIVTEMMNTANVLSTSISSLKGKIEKLTVSEG